MVGWFLRKSSLPEMSDTSWDLIGSVLSSSESSLDPLSENSVVSWLLLDDTLNNLVQPLVSGSTWSSADDLDEVVYHVLEGWSSTWEVLSVPSNTGSLGVRSVPSSHVVPGESVSDWFLTGWLWSHLWSVIWVNWLLWLSWWKWLDWPQDPLLSPINKDMPSELVLPQLSDHTRMKSTRDFHTMEDQEET